MEKGKRNQDNVAGGRGRSWKVFPNNTPNHTRKYNVSPEKKVAVLLWLYFFYLKKYIKKLKSSIAIPSFLSNTLVHIIINVYPVCYSWSDMYA